MKHNLDYFTQMVRAVTFITCIFMTSCAHRTIEKVTYGEPEYVEADYSEAEFVLLVKYDVPDVVSDTDKTYFKTHRPKTVEYSDGTFEMTGRVTGSMSGKYRDGRNAWCNSHFTPNASNDSVEIDLSISWGGQSSGKLVKNLTIAWDDLPQTITDESTGAIIKIERNEIGRKPNNTAVTASSVRHKITGKRLSKDNPCRCGWPGMMLLTMEIQKSDKLLLRTLFDSPDCRGPDYFWEKAGMKPFSSDAKLNKIVPKKDDPLRAIIKGDLQISIKHVNSVKTKANLKKIELVRETPDSHSWYIEESEVERVKKAASL